MNFIKHLNIKLSDIHLIEKNNIEIKLLTFSDISLRSLSVKDKIKTYIKVIDYLINNKKDLIIFEKIIDIIPYMKDVFSDSNFNEILKKIENVIISDLDYYKKICLKYAIDIIKKRWTESDNIDFKTAELIERKIFESINDYNFTDLIRKYIYLSKKRFNEEIENKFFDPKNSFRKTDYVYDIIGTREPRLEKTFIDQNNKSHESLFYAIKVLKKRWTDVDDIDPKVAEQIERNLIKNNIGNYNTQNSLKEYISLSDKRFSEEIENIILDSDFTECDIYYVYTIIKNRVPKIEEKIKDNSSKALEYAINVLKKPWNEVKEIDDDLVKEVEENIYNDFFVKIDYTIFSKKRLPIEIEKNQIFYNIEVDESYKYIDELVKKRVPEFEETILTLLSNNATQKLLDQDKFYIENDPFNEDKINEIDFGSYLEHYIKLSLIAGKSYYDKYTNGSWKKFEEASSRFLNN
jgi:hypothetical protein